MSKIKTGFIYLWLDVKHKRYYLGCHWGFENDRYICSSKWMKQAYKHRPYDFKRRIIKRNIQTRQEMYDEEIKWLKLIKAEEIKPINDNPRYYNLNIKNNSTWHYNEQSRLTVGKKISRAKTGKSIGPCSPEKAKAISEAKKGKVFTNEHKNALKEAKLGTTRSEDAKRKTSETLKQKWDSGEFNRPRAKPKQTMSRTEQDVLCSDQLKNRWSNPEWKENQRLKLKEAWIKRKQNINTNNETGSNQSN
jgi:hypothetical protein